MSSGDTIQDQAPCVPEGAPVVKATICAGPGKGQSISLRRAASLFGTKAGCKLVLRHPTVDRRHCVMINTGQHAFLRDLDTRGRTLRNGLKVEQEVLEDADRVQIGPWELKFDVTMPGLSGAGDSPIIVDLEPDPTVLAVMNTETNKITKLPREVTLLGRSPGCDIPVEDREVSRVHAVIFSYLRRPVIYDLVSENGTFVNGRRATFAMLKDGDEIGLGSYTLRFRSNTQQVGVKTGNNGQGTLKPTPFEPSPEGTLSDLVDFSAESKLQ